MQEISFPKKKISILLALLVSVVVIAVAFIYFKTKSDQDASGATTAGNGDWIQTLTVIDKPAEGSDNIREHLLEGSTTTSDRVGREMIMEYLLAQSQSTSTVMSQESAAAIADHLIQKTRAERINPYTKADIQLAPDTQTALLSYLKGLGKAVDTFTTATASLDEATIMNKALQSQNSQDLAPLVKKIAFYKELEKNLVALKVPPTDTDLHLGILQAYANIRLTDESMATIFDDKTRGLVALGQFSEDLENLARAIAPLKNPPIPKAK